MDDFLQKLKKVVRIVLYCVVLYYVVLYCIVFCCIVLYCIVLYCIGYWPIRLQESWAVSVAINKQLYLTYKNLESVALKSHNSGFEDSKCKPSVDGYAKVGGPGVICPSCSSTMILCGTNLFCGKV